MKLPILGVIAFALGVAGATGAVVMLGPKPEVPPAAHDSTATKADSLVKSDSAHAKSDSAVHQVSAPAHETSETTAVTGTYAPSASSVSGTPPASPAAAVLPAPGTTAPGRDFAKLARLLSAMPAPQAAELLGFLDDNDVEGVLRALGLRQAVGIFGALPKPRAAIMSRRLLVPQSVGVSR
jgi:hypothetical protein